MTAGSPGVAALGGIGRDDVRELAPLLRRAAALDPAALARVRVGERAIAVHIWLPFDVLVARTISLEGDGVGDTTVRAANLLAWADGAGPDILQGRDADWRRTLPPRDGWRRIDTIPDEVVRGLVRSGARVLAELAEREGVPGAQPRRETTDVLLDSVVLTVSADAGGPSAPITLRVLSAAVRMGFLPAGSDVAVDVAGRWTRLAAEYGSVYVERSGLVLQPR